MRERRGHRLLRAAAGLAVALAGAMQASHAWTAGHRDAPAISMDPSADISDVYVFRSWEDPSKAVFIMNVFPGQEPGSGPTFFRFDDNVLYRIHVDNDTDAAADVVYEFRFTTELRSVLGSSAFALEYIGNPKLQEPALRGITALDGPGSEGLALRQTYTVTEVRGDTRLELFTDRRLVAVPSNVGPATMPDYEALAAQGVYADSATGIRVFAGQRAESFYADFGALFDTVNMRRDPPFLSPGEDASGLVNPYGVNRFSGTNVNSIAIEVPISRLTLDGQPPASTTTPLIGMYASTSRPRLALLGRRGWTRLSRGGFVQVSRMANPMFNLFAVDTPDKDRYNVSRPEDDAQFQEQVKSPSLARVFSEVFGLPAAPAPRMDLVSVLLKYPGQPVDGTDCGSPCADLLHLNVQVPPTPAESQHRMGALLSPDPAGLPNGRRPIDDTVDIAIRAFGGPFFFAAGVGDGVNFPDGVPGAGTSDGPGYGAVPGNRLDVSENGVVKEFPFLPTPYDGRDHAHGH